MNSQIPSWLAALCLRVTLHTGSFASLDLGFFLLTWYQKFVKQEKGKFSILLFEISQKIKQSTSVIFLKKNSFKRTCSLEYLRIAELETYRRHLAREGVNLWGSCCWLENGSECLDCRILLGEAEKNSVSQCFSGIQTVKLWRGSQSSRISWIWEYLFWYTVLDTKNTHEEAHVLWGIIPSSFF